VSKTFGDLLKEFRTEVHGVLSEVRAKVGGERHMHELRLQVDGSEQKLSPVLWGHFAHIGTLDKLALMFRRDGEYSTFEVLAIARNVFENLVWLRFLNRDFRNGLVFYAKLLEEEVASYRSYILKINDEAILFDSADQLDGDGLMSTIGAVLDQAPDSHRFAEVQEEHRHLTRTLPGQDKSLRDRSVDQSGGRGRFPI
jgi:hypothetical protein